MGYLSSKYKCNQFLFLFIWLIKRNLSDRLITQNNIKILIMSFQYANLPYDYPRFIIIYSACQLWHTFLYF